MLRNCNMFQCPSFSEFSLPLKSASTCSTLRFNAKSSPSRDTAFGTALTAGKNATDTRSSTIIPKENFGIKSF